MDGDLESTIRRLHHELLHLSIILPRPAPPKLSDETEHIPHLRCAPPRDAPSLIHRRARPAGLSCSDRSGPVLLSQVSFHSRGIGELYSPFDRTRSSHDMRLACSCRADSGSDAET